MPAYNEDMIIVRPVGRAHVWCRNSPLGARFRSGGNPLGRG